MSEQQPPEYGAIHGLTHEWTGADLAASQAQQVSMNAQRNFGSQLAGTFYDGSEPRTWTEMNQAQREVYEALDQNLITPEEARLALMELEVLRPE